MKTMVISRLALSFTFALASTLSPAADEMPWSFNSKRAEGYSIDLVSVTPEPGTPLIVGSAKPEGEKQVVKEVSEKSGELTLEDKITIPKKTKQLLLFVPLQPEGLKVTDGEVVIRYPIKKK